MNEFLLSMTEELEKVNKQPSMNFTKLPRMIKIMRVVSL